jgi:hypothetical protein
MRIIILLFTFVLSSPSFSSEMNLPLNCHLAMQSFFKLARKRIPDKLHESYLKSDVTWKNYENLEDLEISPLNLKWQRMLLMDDIQVVDEATLAYIYNATNSLKGFDNLMNSRDLYGNYIEAFSEQHSNLMTGGDSCVKYSGYVRGNSDTHTGKIGGEIESIDFTNKAGKFRNQNQIISLHFYLSKNELKDLDIVNKVEVLGLAENVWPGNVDRMLGEDRIVHHQYTKPDDIPLYVKRIRDLAMQIIDCQNCSKRKVLELIADDYHIGINSHIFPRVNNSLLMRQINYFLYRISMNGLMHGEMDIYALTMGGRMFREYFIDLVVNEQI